ncbi:hypothetical protein TNCV_1142761 [Trichonephila clavipes]|nr:hypothetical protein TNCV_1142761 [Trichonephila clavipes]
MLVVSTVSAGMSWNSYNQSGGSGDSGNGLSIGYINGEFYKLLQDQGHFTTSTRKDTHAVMQDLDSQEVCFLAARTKRISQ